MDKVWNIKSQNTFSTVEEIIHQLLQNRGLESPQDLDYFLNPPTQITLAGSGLNQATLEEAAKLIKQTISKNLPIVIHGDYDVDGLCATAILWETIYHNLDYKNVTPFIPNRFQHGYGLSTKSLEAVTKHFPQGKGLLITVDCGISSHKVIKQAQKLGLQVLITDHHQKDATENKADAIIWSDIICGATIAWFLANHLVGTEQLDKIDLVALATIADLQVLTGINRLTVKEGLKQLNQNKREGIQALCKSASISDKPIDTYAVGWILAPRLNAQGRLGDGMSALRLLCTQNPAQAETLAGKLSKTNTRRQKLTTEQVEHAVSGFRGTAPAIVMASHPSYHEGIIGLIAGKLCQKFYRPSIAIAQGETLSKGSVRSIPGVNIVEILRKFEHLFEGLGGHPAAAGFTIKTANIEELHQNLLEHIQTVLEDLDLRPELKIDCLLESNNLNWDLVEAVNNLAPFGLGNPTPTFASHGVIVEEARTVGKTDNHLKMKIAFPSGQQHGTIGFNLGYWMEKLEPGNTVSLAYNPEENIWNGRRSLQLKLKGIKKE